MSAHRFVYDVGQCLWKTL